MYLLCARPAVAASLVWIEARRRHSRARLWPGACQVRVGVRRLARLGQACPCSHTVQPGRLANVAIARLLPPRLPIAHQNSSMRLGGGLSLPVNFLKIVSSSGFSSSPIAASKRARHAAHESPPRL